jgi:hypothetical protein
MFDGDGTSRYRIVTYATASKHLAYGLMLLLKTHWGLETTLTERKERFYHDPTR